MNQNLKTSIRLTVIATLGLGIFYPLSLATLGIFMPCLPRPLLLTDFTESKSLFQGRPFNSRINGFEASSLSLTSPHLREKVKERVHSFRKDKSQASFKGVGFDILIPRDLLFASASGYDPHISLQGAYYQIPKISQSHNININVLKKLIDQHTEHKLFGFIGSDKVNVINLNAHLSLLMGLNASS